MSILLSLGEAELLQAVRADIVAERVLDDFRRVRDRQRQSLVVLRGADVAEGANGLLAGEAVEIRQVQRPGHLACAVGAEVHEYHAVALIDNALRADDDRLDELVGLVLGIALLDGVDGIVISDAFAANDGVIALLYAIPALVTIHAPEASLKSGDLGVAELIALFLKLLDKARAALGRDVASVEEAMDIDLLNAALLSHIERRKDVVQVAVHAAGGEKPHDVQRVAAVLGIVHSLDIHGVLEELAVLDLLAYLGQDLEHDAARADVRVSDLGVAHLSLRQADLKAACLELGVGILAEQFIQIRLFGGGNGVARSGRSDAVAVKDYKNCFFAHSLLRLYYSWLVAAMMVAKSTGLRDAPPMRPPSMSGCASSSAAFFAFMLPP